MSESVISAADVRILVAEDRATLVVKSETERGYENSLVRRWDDIDDSKRNACAAYLRRYGSATNTNPAIVSMDGPQASRYKREGVWYFGQVEERRDEATGKVAIWQTLFKSTTTAYSEFIVSDDCSETVTRSLYLNYNNQPDTPDNAPGITYSVSQTLVDPKTGAYTFWIDKTVAKPQTKTYDSLKSESETAQTVEEKAVTAPATSMTPGDGEVRTRNQRVRKDCLVDAETDIKTAVNQVENVYEVRADQTSTATINTQQAEASLPTAPPVPAAGQIKSLKLEPTPYKDRVRTTEETKVAVNQLQTKREVRADLTESVAVNTQVDTGALPTNPPVPAAGETKSLDILPTEFKDRAKTIEATRTAINQTIVAKEVRADETTVSTVNTQVADSALPTNPPVPDAGQIKTLKIEPTAFKERNKTEEETRAVIDQTQTAREVRADQSSVVTVHTAKDVASLPTTPPVPDAGEYKTVKLEPTPFKDRTKTTEETVTGHNQTQTEKEVTPAFKRVRTTNTQVAPDDLPDALPVPGDGEQKVVVIKPTPFKDRSETIEETKEAVEILSNYSFESRFGTHYVWEGVNAEIDSFNADLAEAALTSATTNNVDKEPSKEFKNRYNYRITKEPNGGGGSGSTDADYEAIGQFLFPMNSPDNVRVMAVAVIYTISKAVASAWAKGTDTTHAGTGEYGTMAAVNTAMGWSTSAIITHCGAWSTGAWRNRSTGRWTSVRCHLKLT